MERKLASIQKIVDLQPIEGADKIEVATVLGWHIVVSKSENHKVGDLICYIEVDSQCPETPMFEFLKDRKYRVRTIKLRKQVSQGLVIPLSAMPKGNYIEGQDVTKLLGITKYDPQAEAEAKLMEEEMRKNKNPIHKFLMKYKWYRKLYNKFKKPKKGGFPSWISKTDETRIQSLSREFYDIVSKNNTSQSIAFDSTEKLDGQSGTFFIKKYKKFGFINSYEFGVCSRNLRIKTENNSSYWTVARQYNIEDTLKSILKKYNANNIVLQGEICGEGIQGNKYHISGDGFYFAVFNLIIDGKKHRTCEIKEILKSYKIDTVPIIDTDVLLKDTIDEMVENSKGNSVFYKTKREGKVWRSTDCNTSFKVINPDFLLKHDE